MFTIVSHTDSLSLVAVCVLCILARDRRSKAGYSCLMSFVAVSSSCNRVAPIPQFDYSTDTQYQTGYIHQYQYSQLVALLASRLTPMHGLRL